MANRANINSTAKYVVVTPGVVLSEHMSLSEARRARTKSIREGFADVVILKQNDGTWEEVKEGNRGEDSAGSQGNSGA